MIKSNFIALYEELSDLWSDNTLQESKSYIQTLHKAYKKGKLNDPDMQEIESIRGNGVKELPFLSHDAFDPYFEYLEEIFKANGNCRYPINPNYHNALHAHHIVFKYLGGSDSVNNLIALSKQQHTDAHIKFVECLTKYLNAADTDTDTQKRLYTDLAKAINSVKMLNQVKQDTVSIKELLHLLQQSLINEGNKEVGKDNLNTDELIKKINALNIANHLAVFGRVNHGGVGNLQRGARNTYIVSFTNGKKIEANGIDEVRDIIHKETGKEISKNAVQNRITTQKGIPPLNKRGNDVIKKSFSDYNLEYPNGIFKKTDVLNSNSRHKSKPIIYFPVEYKDNSINIDYSRGKWVASPGALKTAGIGEIDDPYSRLDEIHTWLEQGVAPISIFKGKHRGGQDFRDNYIFIYADDKEDLQKVINKENSSRPREQQIALKVMKGDDLWYPERNN